MIYLNMIKACVVKSCQMSHSYNMSSIVRADKCVW